MPKYNSSSLERCVMIYLKPREYMLFEAERRNLIRGKSEHGKELLIAYYKGMSDATQRQLLDDYLKYVKGNKK